MESELLYRVKNVDKEGNIVEMKIWKVQRTEVKPHGLKYSLVYIKKGQRIVGYDNAEGKGDHRHYFDKELPYSFESIDKLIKDFWEDVKRAKRGEL